MDTGTRPQPGLHLPYYYARTVAHNCVTVRMQGEKFPRYWSGPSALEPKNLPIPNDGGQRELLVSKLLALEETDDYVYLASDATGCYHEDKVDLVVREFILCAPDVFVIFDRIVSDKPEYAKRWLYHTATEPKMIGKLEFSETSQGGKAICRTLYPKDAKIEKIGGPGRQFWSDGRNWGLPELIPEDHGYRNRHLIPKEDDPMLGQWRIEVIPGGERTVDYYMHIIQVGDEGLKALPKTKTFNKSGRLGTSFTYNGKEYNIDFDISSEKVTHGCKINVITK